VLQWTGVSQFRSESRRRKNACQVANCFAKRDPHFGRCPLSDEASQREALARLELTDLWGIAGRLTARLNAIGITTPFELHDADHRLIRERFSVVLEHMVLELRGLACIDLEEVSPDRKSLIASQSFGQGFGTRRASKRRSQSAEDTAGPTERSLPFVHETCAPFLLGEDPTHREES